MLKAEGKINDAVPYAKPANLASRIKRRNVPPTDVSEGGIVNPYKRKVFYIA
jgi:hypothetical protein